MHIDVPPSLSMGSGGGGSTVAGAGEEALSVKVGEREVQVPFSWLVLTV